MDLSIKLKLASDPIRSPIRFRRIVEILLFELNEILFMPRTFQRSYF